MIRIAVCDGNKSYLKILELLLQKFIAFHKGVEIVFNLFENPFDLLDEIEKGTAFHIFMLEMDFSGIDGIQIAKEIRKQGSQETIIFITENKDRALDAFGVNATQYLIKGFSEDVLFDCLQRATEFNNSERRRHMIFPTKEGYMHVYARHICYSIGDGKYQHIHMENGDEFVVRITNKQLAGDLTASRNFFKCGSSYVLNLFFIENLTTSQVTMFDGTVIPIPKGLHKDIKKCYVDFFKSIDRIGKIK